MNDDTRGDIGRKPATADPTPPRIMNVTNREDELRGVIAELQGTARELANRVEWYGEALRRLGLEELDKLICGTTPMDDVDWKAEYERLIKERANGEKY
jgi:hypothetical protein